jgi:hypothetical protein
METTIYRESQVMKFRWLLTLVGVVVMAVGAWQTWPHQPFESVIMILFALLFAVILYGFTEFSVVITPTELRFGFPIYRKRFRLTEISVGDIEKIAVLAGIGIHFWNRKWVYNGRYGRGVNVTHGRYHYLLGSNSPEQLQNALLQQVPHAPVAT